MKQSNKITAIILAAAACIFLIAAGVLITRQLNDERETQALLDNLRASAEALKEQREEAATAQPTVAPEPAATAQPTETPEETATTQPTETPEPAATAQPTGTPEPAATAQPTKTPEPAATAQPTAVPNVNPYRDSFLANEHMAAWIQIPGTVIDYPVMWTPEDEEYYLYRGFDGKDNQNGCLILDTDSCVDPLSTNLIIHGHNMKSGAMFGDLTNYENYSYYEKHKEIILYTEGVQRNYEVIAVFRSQVYKKSDNVFKYYKFFQANSQEEFDDFYENIKALSQYDTGVTAQYGDHFLTLSTCVYHVENGRFVVVAKEVENGDSYLPLSE